MGWFFLLIAGILEIGFAITLKMTHGNDSNFLKIIFLIFIVGSFYFLDKSLSTIPVGTAYAVWTGIGATGTAIIGMIIFNDPASILRIIFLGLLIISIIGLRITSGM